MRSGASYQPGQLVSGGIARSGCVRILATVLDRPLLRLAAADDWAGAGRR